MTVEWVHSVPVDHTVKMNPPDGDYFQVSCTAPPPGPLVNLIQNPSFDNAEGWQFYKDEGNPTGAIENGEAKITGALQEKGRWFTGINIPVTPGESYILYATLRGEFTEAEAYVCATWWDSGKKYVGPPTHSEYLTESGKTVGLRVEAVAPAEAALARVEVRAWPVNGSVWCDDVHFGPGPSLKEKLKERAMMQQLARLNPDAALQKRILSDGFWVSSNEFEVDGYIGQRAEHPTQGWVRVYYVPKGDWGNVRYI